MYYIAISVARALRNYYRNYTVFRCHGIAPSQNSVIFDPESISIGERFSHGLGCRLYCQDPDNGSQLVIGHDVSLNDGVVINADHGGEIVIGNNVLMGPGVVIRAANHNYLERNVLIRHQGITASKIQIEDDVWLGAGVIVLSDVTIGRGAVVGAGSVVTKSIEPFAMAVGVPARVVKYRN